MDIRILGLALLLTAVAAPATAEEPGACQADIDRFCKPADPVVSCLTAHERELHYLCKYAVVKHRRAYREACGSDIAKFCAGVSREGGLQTQCLKQRADELTAGCRSFIAVSVKERLGWRPPPPKPATPCDADAARLCPGLAPGPALGKCMRKSEKGLSAECQTSVRAKKKAREAYAKGDDEKSRGLRACDADMDKFCGGLVLGPELSKCWTKHENEFSKDCLALKKKQEAAAPAP